jgi:hypothetical protein
MDQDEKSRQRRRQKQKKQQERKKQVHPFLAIQCYDSGIGLLLLLGSFKKEKPVVVQETRSYASVGRGRVPPEKQACIGRERIGILLASGFKCRAEPSGAFRSA